MARQICDSCYRPVKTCICGFIQLIDNQIELGILQHPSEFNHPKGSAIIAQLSLKNCRYWVAEEVSDSPEFLAWLNSEPKTLLLYPETDDFKQTVMTIEQLQPATVSLAQKPLKILVLDASWRKSYKMMQLNPQLNLLDRIVLNPDQPSGYQIRKQKNPSCLASVEAIYQLCSQLEKNPAKYLPLLKAFEQMQSLQLGYRSKA